MNMLLRALLTTAVMAGCGAGGATVPYTPPAMPPQPHAVASVNPKPVTPPPPTQTVVEVPGEETATPVTAIPTVRLPHGNGETDLTADTLNATSASTLAEALKALPVPQDDRKRFFTLFLRARRLAGLAQAPFSAEPPERQRRLRAVALHAALDGYKEALGVAGTTWGNNGGGCLADGGQHGDPLCPDKGWFLYVYGLLLEQAGDRDNAAHTYAQTIAERVTTAAGTQPRWGEADALSHWGLATLAEAANDAPTILKEYDLVFQVLDCTTDTSKAMDVFACGDNPPVRRAILEHIRADHPSMIAEIERLQQERARQAAVSAALAQVWAPVEQVADDIAQKKWMIQYARQTHTYTAIHGDVLRTRPTDEASLQRSEVGIVRYAHDRLCPLKKVFVAQAGTAEFTKRAAAHCKDHAPMGSGQGNLYAGVQSGQVVLTSQCQAAFATPCP